MPSNWIRCIHKGPVGKRWSPRENAYRYNAEDMSCNAGIPEYDNRVHVEFSMEPTKEDWLSSVQRVRLPLVIKRVR